MGHAVGARRVDRHAIGDRRSPGGIGAGVEVAAKSQANQASRRHRSRARARISRRMALGCAAMRSPAAYRRSAPAGEFPRRERHQRLHREIELAAEAAAAVAVGTRSAPRSAPSRMMMRDLVAIHDGRLRADDDFDAIADAHRHSRPRARYRRARRSRSRTRSRPHRRIGKGSLDIALHHAAPHQHIVGLVCMQQVAHRRASRLRCRSDRRQDRPDDRHSSSRDCRHVARVAHHGHAPARRDSAPRRRPAPAGPCWSDRCR